MRNLHPNEQSLKTLVRSYKVTKCNILLGDIYVNIFPKLYIYCKRLSRNDNDAYDFATEAFLKIPDKIHGLKETKYFTSWLFRIAHNLYIDSLRVKKKQQTFGFENNFDLVDDISDQILLNEKEALIKKMHLLLEKIEPKSKEILIAKYIRGYSMSEIQSELEISLSAAKMRISRAKRKVVSIAS